MLLAGICNGFRLKLAAVLEASYSGASVEQEVIFMPKGKDKGQTQEKKKPQHTLKEKRKAKQEKKASKGE